MWDSALLKTNAKNALRGRYWQAFLISFIVAFLAGGSPGIGTYSFNSVGRDARFEFREAGRFRELFEQYKEFLIPVLIAAAVLIPVAVFFGIAFGLFVSNPIRVGQSRYYLENRYQKPEILRLFSSFGPQYMNIVKTMFFKGLYIFLWSLLLVIPGIVKSYEYFAVEYILAENPGIDPKRALELSRRMTDGRKWDIFVLNLSFLGWFILCMFTAGAGFLFLAPYLQATYAELYSALRDRALETGIASPEELPGTVPPVPPAPPFAPPPVF